MTISRPSSRDPALELDPTRFHPIILTPYGEWWRWGNNAEHNDFMSNVAHSDDGPQIMISKHNLHDHKSHTMQH